MHTVLGSGGIIGKETSFSLSEYTSDIKQVSRNPKKVNDQDYIFPADLTKESDVRAAVKGSDVVYLTVGLPYVTKVWEENWPKIMTHTINACMEHQSKLVFLDNVYMYGQVDGWMTEQTSINPCSKKGEVRAKIARQLMDEVDKGNIKALIARAADFYGPEAHNTYILPMIFDKLARNKKPQLMISAHQKHSYTYTPDLGKALALLGQSDKAYGQVWHLPTHRDALTGAEFVKLVSEQFNKKPNYSVLNSSMLSIAGLFSPIVRETKEMRYQFKYDYLFDSSKFEEAFFAPTSYKDGVMEIFQLQYKQSF